MRARLFSTNDAARAVSPRSRAKSTEDAQRHCHSGDVSAVLGERQRLGAKPLRRFMVSKVSIRFCQIGERDHAIATAQLVLGHDVANSVRGTPAQLPHRLCQGQQDRGRSDKRSCPIHLPGIRTAKAHRQAPSGGGLRRLGSSRRCLAQESVGYGPDITDLLGERSRRLVKQRRPLEITEQDRQATPRGGGHVRSRAGSRRRPSRLPAPADRDPPPGDLRCARMAHRGKQLQGRLGSWTRAHSIPARRLTSSARRRANRVPSLRIEAGPGRFLARVGEVVAGRRGRRAPPRLRPPIARRAYSRIVSSMR